MRGFLRRAAIIAGATIAYLLAARFSQGAAAAHAVVSSVWVPAGIALFLVVHLGAWCWPAIALGAFAFNLSNGVPWPASLAIAAGNSVEAILALKLMTRLGAFRSTLDRMRDVFALVVLGAVVSTLASALVGVAALTISGDAPGSTFLDLLVPWWTGDAVGMLLVAPLLLSWTQPLDVPARSAHRVLELIVTYGALFFFAELVLGVDGRLLYAIFPPVFWFALRHGMRGASMAVGLVAAIATRHVIVGEGPLALPTLEASLVQLQIFLLLLAVPTLIFSSAVAESRTTELQLQQQSEQLAAAQRLAHLGSWYWDARRGRVTWSPQLAEILRIDGEPESSVEECLALLHPSERADMEAVVRRAMAERSTFERTQRVVLLDGTPRMLITAGKVVSSPTGQIAGIMGVCYDITEQWLTQEKARERAELLRQVYDITARLAATVDVRAVLDVLILEGASVVPAGRASAGIRDASGLRTRRAQRQGVAFGVTEGRDPFAGDRFDDTHVLTMSVTDANAAEIGSFSLMRDPHEPPFTPTDRARLQAVAHTAGLALERALRVEELERRTEELTQSDARYRALAHDLPDAAVALFDRDFRLLVADGPVLERIGLSRTLAEGRTLREVLPAAQAEELARRFGEVFAGSTMEFEFEYLSAVYLVKAMPLRAPDGTVTVGMALGVDITERREQDSVRSRLLAELMQVQEEERRRIARELHDEAGQSLTAIVVGLRALRQSPTLEHAHALAERLGGVAADTITNIGRLARGLHPTVLDDHGLRKALERFAEEFTATHGIPVDLHLEGVESQSLATDLQAELYRIVIEALTNVARHSAATRASVFMGATRGELAVVIEDDGSGFDVTRVLRGGGGEPPMGLLGIRERAANMRGTARFDSTPGRGTTVVVRVPNPPTESDL